MRRFLLIAAGGAALLITSASAGFVPKLTLAQQAKKADLIVQARVTEVKQQEQGGQKWTVYVLKVGETLAGSVADLPTLNGAPALWVLGGLDGAPTFAANDEAVLLLYKGLLDSPVVGVNQGIYPLKGGKVQGQSVSDPAAFKKSLLDARVAP